jgi:hypothetical protein
LRVLTSIGSIAGGNLTNSPLAKYIKKSAKRRACSVLPILVKNPPKLKEKLHTNYPQSEEVTTGCTGIEKNPDREPPAIVFICSGGTMIQSGYMESCLTAQKRFLLFKGPGSFKKK